VDGKSSAEVLGTSFNINSYRDEGTIKTTLLEGSVKVAVAASSDAVLLKPGQQAVLRDTTSVARSSARQPETFGTGGKQVITVSSNPDIEQTLAWKDGLFNFNGSDLRAVMRQLERWYDIKVTYEGSVPRIIFKGGMDRKVNLSDVLEFFTEMGLKFRMDGKTLIVTSSSQYPAP
ncbi:MAG TPA: FecR domain-containing protein, partial [Flavitalea sp.]|nr:FecR domain-containing protein [Flavitalea sp.]